MGKYGKTAVFPGGYGWIGEIPHAKFENLCDAMAFEVFQQPLKCSIH